MHAVCPRLDLGAAPRVRKPDPTQELRNLLTFVVYYFKHKNKEENTALILADVESQTKTPIYVSQC